MTITRRRQTGFELNSTTAECTLIGTAPTNPTISTTQKKTGTYSLRMGANATASYAALWTVPATRQLRFGFHVWLDNSQTPASNPYVANLSTAADAVMVGLRFDHNLGVLYLYDYGGTSRDSITGINVLQFYHIGIDVKIDSSSGWLKVYIDGVLSLEFTGDTGNTDITRVIAGIYPYVTNASLAAAKYYYFDDVTIDDTTGEPSPAPVPDRRYSLLTPSGDGTYSQWKNSSGTSVNNYLYVDEVPYNTTDYVNISGSGFKDSYGMTDFSIPANSTISAVIPMVVAQKNDASDTQLMLGTILSGTELLGSSQTLLTSYGLVTFERQTSKPGGGAWTGADVNAMEFLMMSSGTFA